MTKGRSGMWLKLVSASARMSSPGPSVYQA